MSLKHPKLTKARWKLTYSRNSTLTLLYSKSFSAFFLLPTLGCLTHIHSTPQHRALDFLFPARASTRTSLAKSSAAAILCSVSFLGIYIGEEIPPNFDLTFFCLMWTICTRTCSASFTTFNFFNFHDLNQQQRAVMIVCLHLCWKRFCSSTTHHNTCDEAESNIRMSFSGIIKSKMKLNRKSKFFQDFNQLINIDCNDNYI